MDHLHGGNILIDAPVAEIDHGSGGAHADVLQQRGGLLELARESVAVVRVTREGARTDH